MAFITKEWKDRLTEFAGRRRLANVATGEETIVDVTRNEGTVSQEGDAFSAANMNDLEQRIANEFNTVNNNLGGLSFYEDTKGNKYVVGADSVPKKLGELDVYSLFSESILSFSGLWTAKGTGKNSGDISKSAILNREYEFIIVLYTDTNYPSRLKIGKLLDADGNEIPHSVVLANVYGGDATYLYLYGKLEVGTTITSVINMSGSENDYEYSAHVIGFYK